MKKVYFLAIVLVLMLTLSSVSVAADTLGETVDLIAGQNTDVGDVTVWNDVDNLYVKFDISGDWCLLESHVAVGGSVADIPQTKKDNPVPGKFLYTASYSNPPCMQDPDPYVIPLEWGLDETVFIAAHASVVHPVEGCYESVWQIGDVEVFNATTGWLENYADEFNWEYPADAVTAGPSLAASEPAFTTPFIVGTTPENQFPYNSNYVRDYATDIDVQWMGALPFGGKLSLSWSPGQSATEKKVISDGFPTATFTAVGAAQSGQGWFLNTYPLVEHSVLVDPVGYGTHTINFKHTQGDGTFWDWIRLEKVCEQKETGWGNGSQFEGSNWGMYFTYTIQPSVVVEGDVFLNVEYRFGDVPYSDNDTRQVVFQVYNDGTGTLYWTQNSGYHNVVVDTLTVTGNVAEFSGIAVDSSSRTGDRLYIKVLDDAPDFYENWWDPADIWGYSVVSGDIIVQ